jgi:hypothetical protein
MTKRALDEEESRDLFDELKEVLEKKRKEIEDRNKQAKDEEDQKHKQVEEELGNISLNYKELSDIIANDLKTNVDLFWDKQRYQIRGMHGNFFRKAFADSASWQKLIDVSEKKYEDEMQNMYKDVIVSKTITDFIRNWCDHNPKMPMTCENAYGFLSIDLRQLKQ